MDPVERFSLNWERFEAFPVETIGLKTLFCLIEIILGDYSRFDQNH